MEHLDLVAKIFFRDTSAQSVLRGDIRYSDFPRKDYEVMALSEMKHLTESETGEIYRYLKEHTENYTNENGLNVFRLLKELSAEMIYIRDDRPVCRYEKLLRWREFVRWLGEDLPVCAFLACFRERTGMEWIDFGWEPVIGHDNRQLNCLMQRGISDNHFHLFGSSPSFHLIWMRLMNDVSENHYVKVLQEIDADRRVPHSRYSLCGREETLGVMHIQAALIRLVLFYYLKISLADGKEDNSGKVLQRIPSVITVLLDDTYRGIYREEIQSHIRALRLTAFVNTGNDVDYALPPYGGHGSCHDFSGERFLIYHMLCGQVRGRAIPADLMNLFYAYLIIKGEFYSELVQVNDILGFQNFHTYQRRYWGFLNTDTDRRRMVEHAVADSMAAGNIRSLEVRISPEATAAGNQRMIRCYRKWIGEILREDDRKRVYFVFHFPKQKDDCTEEAEGMDFRYRHYSLRENLARKGDALIRFREMMPEEAAWVCGIDACSQEIGCRPEVFAPTFRQLASHVGTRDMLWNGTLPPYQPQSTSPVAGYSGCGRVKQWNMTYHVGEDWLDLLDALRAIDEAVAFLNLKNGDRLGHATVLGLDVKKWYELKSHRITLPIQDYLDNIVWLYHKLVEFDIRSCENLKGFILEEFEENFRLLYGRYMRPDIFEELEMRRVRLYGRDNGEGEQRPDTANIHTCYEAWKLRGDHPSLYRRGFYYDPYRSLKPYMINEELPNGSAIRARTDAGFLYYLYHYSKDIRIRGRREKQIAVSNLYVDGVAKVQAAMQRRISQIGIGIETNPSSNYLISSMETYEDHPISRLFNMGLTSDNEKIRECAQLHVSINTDDKGVFHTSLENEFALMSCAMEQAVNEDGSCKYQRQMVYDWLDRIREFGNQQSFLERGG